MLYYHGILISMENNRVILIQLICSCSSNTDLLPKVQNEKKINTYDERKKNDAESFISFSLSLTLILLFFLSVIHDASNEWV